MDVKKEIPLVYFSCFRKSHLKINLERRKFVPVHWLIIKIIKAVTPVEGASTDAGPSTARQWMDRLIKIIKSKLGTDA